jgi:hypothetical protein
LALVQLRAVATLLGTSQQERVELLQSAAHKTVVPADEPSVVSEKLQALLPPIRAARAALTDDLIKGLSIDSLREQATAAQALLGASDYLFELWSQLVRNNAVSYPVIDQQVNLLRSAIGDLVGTSTSLPVTSLQQLSRTPEALGTLLQLRASLETSSPVFEATVQTALDAPETSPDRLDIMKLLAGLPTAERSPLRDDFGSVARIEGLGGGA